MRSICIAVTAGGLLFAPMAQAEPLSPGKPAGVHAAKFGARTGLLIIGTALVAGLAAAVVSTGGDNNAGIVVPTATTG